MLKVSSFNACNMPVFMPFVVSLQCGTMQPTSTALVALALFNFAASTTSDGAHLAPRANVPNEVLVGAP